MAIARLSVKVGKAGKAAGHAAYIARLGKYACRLERGEKLEATEAGNMPAWARSNPLAFWQAADAHERKNGSTYREFEIALPRELPPEARIALVRDFVRQEIGERHAYQWAIHTPTAADGGEQPHVHLMFSERQCDGIERDPEQYFRRYNPKSPEKGGAKKGYGPNAGKTLSRAERAKELKALRERWGDLCNAHLESAGVEQRIDMRSHAERGTGLEPERKQLPSEWRGQGRDNVIEFRQARAELLAARQELASAVPDASAEIISLEAERAKRAALEAQLEAERLAEEQRLAEAERRRDIQERAMLRHGYRTDSWEIQARWEWRQQGRELQRRAEEAIRQLEAEQARIEREAEEATAAQRAWSATEPWAPMIAGRGQKKTLWQEWRDQTLAERYGKEIAERAVEQNWYIRMRPDLGGLNIHDSQGRGIIDTGTIVKAENIEGDRDIPLMLELAKAKGWSALMIEGSDDFRLAAAAAALQKGFSLNDKELEKAARQRIEQERLAARKVAPREPDTIPNQTVLAEKPERPVASPARSHHGPDIGDEW
ncbi:MobA/MobL family protein [Acidithiobacillus sp. VAN18-1]|uniref:MobA/MobL family protein n=1 Tax=Igneacidithiobacillus copahuensis TaxID=2724909 RepID=A0AAE3CKC8_9PROT|nr:MobA/MobL family protein [Igneacidithiobacillus copahuensis]MBU2788345.1 MobA/MobL family protein [Igneacidithiobacillus copahuensis]MBU2795518.1 MobA/MobL family protein [Acidithiobacillus sp. VAN18-2]